MAYKAGKARESVGKAMKGMGKANPGMAFPKGGSYSAKWPLSGKGKSSYCPKMDKSKM